MATREVEVEQEEINVLVRKILNQDNKFEPGRGTRFKILNEFDFVKEIKEQGIDCSTMEVTQSLTNIILGEQMISDGWHFMYTNDRYELGRSIDRARDIA